MAQEFSGRVPDWHVGTTHSFYLLCLDADGDRRDISAATLTFRVKTNKEDTDAQSIVSVEADLTEGENGYAVFTVTASDTKDATPGRYYYDIEYVEGLVEDIAHEGQVTLLERVSDVPA